MMPEKYVLVGGYIILTIGKFYRRGHVISIELQYFVGYKYTVETVSDSKYQQGDKYEGEAINLV
ncbi:hypothetical protein D3C87_2134930 [compost metagenome]